MSLPLVGRVAAGSPILAQEHVETTYSVDPAMFSAKPDFLLKVKGWSMRDAGICDGDFLAVKKVDSAKNGQIVVARIGDEVTVKRYRKSGSTIELLPETRTSPSSRSIRRATSSRWKAWRSACCGPGTKLALSQHQAVPDAGAR